MKCEFCGAEMQKGTVSFMSIQGFGQMLATFSSSEEQKKSIFKRKTKEKIIFSGDEAEAYYCNDCNKILPVMDI